ncbi:MAG: response regulator [Cyclobacteriaceae bacterium]|nr:response regulator [Cyclobacteriaceae bacterium]
MNSGKILLVEDSDDDAVLLYRAFKKKNMLNEIVRAKDGIEALELVFGTEEKPPLMPCLILLDLKLPKMDGLEVLQALRANKLTQGLPIIILTTSVEQQDIVKGYNLGCNSYIRKPVEFDKFLESVGQLGLYWMMLNEGNPNYTG